MLVQLLIVLYNTDCICILRRCLSFAASLFLLPALSPLTAMDLPIDPKLIPSDVAVLKNLLRDIELDKGQETGKVADGSSIEASLLSSEHDDDATLAYLEQLRKDPVVINSRDYSDLSAINGTLGQLISWYTVWASEIVRNPVDVVFVTHLILYLGTSVPSAIFLYYRYTHVHGVLHWLLQLSYCGSFTLLLHNHIHNNGLFRKDYALIDHAWPWILQPLMGHTWHSYYYHHVKHHHIEGNGPEDLSSTIRYQRDELSHFLAYLLRFMFLIWYDLPRYFVRKGKYVYAFKSGSLELLSYASIVALARWQFAPTLWVFIIPLVQMRIGLMIGNFGQHALVDNVDPGSDFRSSITLIDVDVCVPCPAFFWPH